MPWVVSTGAKVLVAAQRTQGRTGAIPDLKPQRRSGQLFSCRSTQERSILLRNGLLSSIVFAFCVYRTDPLLKRAKSVTAWDFSISSAFAASLLRGSGLPRFPKGLHL